MLRCARCWRRLGGDVCAEHGPVPAPTVAAPAPPVHPPAELSGFRTGPCIAVGGSAHVFAAGDAVIKWGRWCDVELRARFEHEARVLRRIGGGRAPRLFASGAVDGWPYLVLEWLRAPTLADQLADRGALAPEEAAARLAAIAAALDDLHRLGVSHGDLKPENLIGDGDQVRVLDFGLARTPDDAAGGPVGGGTLHYVAPEQLAGERPGPASDVYALGAIGFELLTGRPPFVGDRPTVEYGHALCRPPHPAALAAVPEHLDALVLACLAKDPARRPGVAEVARQLAAADAGPALAPAARAASRSERGPAVLMWISAGDRLAIAREIATSHGRVLRERGDGTLAAFTWLDHDAPLNAAIGLARTLAARGHAIALHAATVMARRTASAVRLYGDAIDHAERWRPPAPWTGILATAHLGSGEIPVEDSLTHPGYVTVLDGARSSPSRVETVPELMARGGLVADLLDAIDRAWRDQRPILITITGGSGLGKSRLLDEVRRAGADRAGFVEVAAAPRLGGRGTVGPLLLAQLGGGAHMLDGLRAAAGTGTIVIVDDAHWVEDEVLDAIETATAWPQGRLAVIVTTTPSLRRARPRWGERAAATLDVTLPALTDDSARRLLRRLLHPAVRIPAPLIERLAARAAGIPGALVAIATEIRRRGLIQRHPASDEWYVAADQIDFVELEPGVKWRAARELASLPPGMAELVELAACLGPRFGLDEVEAIQRALPPSPTCIDPQAGLDWLTRNRLVRRDGASWSLASASQAEAIYQQLDDAARAAIHRAAFAYWSSARPGAGDAAGRLAHLAHHGERAGEHARAAEAYLQLAIDARGRLAHVEAERMATHALTAIADRSPALTARALLERGRARCPLGLYEAARADLARAAALAGELGDRIGAIEARIAETAVCDFAEWVVDAAALIEEAAALAGDDVPPATEARLHNWLGVIRARQERAAESEALLERAVATADRLGELDTVVGSLLMLGAMRRRRGAIEPGLAAVDRALELSRRRDDVFHLTVGLFNRINYWRVLGRPELAAADCAAAIELAEVHGYGEAEARGWYNMASLRFFERAPDEARTAARRAYQAARTRFGTPPLAPTLFLAALEAGLGDRDAARALLGEADRDAADATPWTRALRTAVELAVRSAPLADWRRLDSAASDDEDAEVLTWLRDRSLGRSAP